MKFTALFFLILSSLHSAVAQAINFNFNTSGLNAQASLALDRAGQAWSDKLTDQITINIDVSMKNLGNANVIGQAGSTLLMGDYEEVRNAMISDAASEVDDQVVSFLPDVDTASFFIPTDFTLTANLSATKANFKALGATGLDAQFGSVDGVIEFNTRFNFDFNSSDGVDAGAMDFETVAAHEIGHILGFVSVVDTIDSLVNAGQTAAINPFTLDMFRFGTMDNPETFSEFTTASRDLLPGGETFFDDIASEVLFSTGPVFGDGNQASHWKADDITGNYIGIMDPTLSLAQISPITHFDVRALDVIGYDVVTVPLPGAIWFFGSGLLLFLNQKNNYKTLS